MNERTNEGVYIGCQKISYHSPINEKNCCKADYIYLKFVNEIYKLSQTVSTIASILVGAVKFVNSFARRQHLFDIAAKLIDVDSNILSYPAPLFMF